jgi:hypothetical protein
MDDDQSFAYIARECGIDPNHHNKNSSNARYSSYRQYGVNSPRFSDYHDEIGGYMHMLYLANIIMKYLENSSPSPPERYSTSRLVPYTHWQAAQDEQRTHYEDSYPIQSDGQLSYSSTPLRSYGREPDSRTCYGGGLQ